MPPTIVREWITTENVNQICSENGIKGEIDLLSIDLDGIDYWVWRALDVIRPRVVVVEFNDLWGADRAVTVPNSPEFRGVVTKYGWFYGGASLPALVKLGRQKGYRLVGTVAMGINAFFLRDGIGETLLPEVEAKDCLDHPRIRFGTEKRRAIIECLQWEDV